MLPDMCNQMQDQINVSWDVVCFDGLKGEGGLKWARSVVWADSLHMEFYCSCGCFLYCY